MSEWVNTLNRLPNDGDLVLLYHNRSIKLVVYNHTANCWDDEYGDDYYMDVEGDDLWMDIPFPNAGGK